MKIAIKPKVVLTDSDGNAFSILAKCLKAARRAGWDQAKIDKVVADMRAGDYDHLMQTAMQHFKVT